MLNLRQQLTSRESDKGMWDAEKVRSWCWGVLATVCTASAIPLP